MKFLAITVLFTLSALPMTAEDLGLRQYLQRLETAPGVTVDDKIIALERQGVTLSRQGKVDLANLYLDGLEASTGNPTPSDNLHLKDRTSHWSNRFSATSMDLGGFRFHNFNNGVRGSTIDLDGFKFSNFSNGVRSTTIDVGGFRFHNLNNGLRGTTTDLGDFQFHKFSNGTNCTSNRIGSFTYTNCN